MANIGTVRSALTDVIAEAGVAVAPFLTEQHKLPTALVDFAGYRTEAMARGTVSMQWDVTVVAPLAHGRISTQKMDELVAPFGSSSIPQQIWANRTLGRDDCDAHVAQVSGYTQVEGYGLEHVACTVSVIVHTRGDS